MGCANLDLLVTSAVFPSILSRPQHKGVMVGMELKKMATSEMKQSKRAYLEKSY